MAHTLDHVPSISLFTRLAEVFVAIGENSARGQMAREISLMSDEQLKALGTNRAELVQRRLGLGHI